MSDLVPRIFVNIAAYRDTECQWTVKDLFEKAKYKDRIFLGICWQFIAEEDEDCFLFGTRPKQSRVINIDARESKGACWARHKAQSLWQGEEYTLQIDSHMRFVPDWDEKLLTMLRECPSERPLLSHYPSSYVPPDKIESNLISFLYARNFDQHGVLKLHCTAVEEKDAPAAPKPNPFIAAGFLFGDSQINIDVPYDPYLYFQGEEITLSARLWTHGWDVFAPNKVLIWHDYSKRPERPRHWTDHKQWDKLNLSACKRARHLLGVEATDDAEALIDIDKYGLGTARTLADYEQLIDVRFAQRLVRGKTQAQLEAEDAPEEQRKRNEECFTRIWRGNGWGSPETRSGPGSTIAATEILRADLAALCKNLGIRSLTDAGCGDLNWMGEISRNFTHYFGLDVVKEMIDQNREKYGRRRGHFFSCADITIDDLPPCDAILCRDVLTHLPDYGVNFALRQFKASGARYLIATTHPGGENRSINVGDWQPINLAGAPFNLPPPHLVIPDGTANKAKHLGVWHLASLP